MVSVNAHCVFELLIIKLGPVLIDGLSYWEIHQLLRDVAVAAKQTPSFGRLDCGKGAGLCVW